MRILVADDSQPIRQRLVERLLGLSGVCVAEAENTMDALQQIETFAPDVAVLDIRMPGGGGIKVLGEIKAKHPSVIVMIVTSYPYAQYRRKCLEAGADFFFDKSTEFEQVAEIVRQLGHNGNSSEVAHRIAFAQLVDAKEKMERIEQRQRDLRILGNSRKSAGVGGGTESAYDQAYAMWEKTFDTLLDLVAIFDADQHIVRVNKALADRMGVPPAELVGKKCYEYLHGKNCPIVNCPHEIMLKERKEHSAEIYDELMRGWFEIRVSPIYETGQLIGVIHFARDITKRKQAEMQARTTLDSLSANIAIVDENGVILSVNRSWEKFAEVNHFVCGMGVKLNYLAVCDGAMGSGNEDAIRFAEGLRSVLRGECDFFEMEYPCVIESGLLWFCGRVTPFPGTGPRRAVVAHEDITVRKQSEAAVRKSERELRYVIGAIFEGLWDWDLVKDTAHCNAQWYQMLGYEPDEFPVSRKSLLQLTHPEDLDLVEKAHDAFSQAEDTVPYTSVFRLLRKDGSYAWIWSSGSVVERDDEGKPLRMMGVHSDVTEKMEAGEALKSSEERYRQLFESMHAGFALHEIICDGNGVPCDYYFLEVNSAFETLSELTAEQMIGKRGKEVLPWIASHWIDVYGKVALTGVPTRIDDFPGTPGRYYSVSVYSPKRGQFATVFSDVTEQRNAQEVVRKARDAAEEANRAKTQLLANMSHELRTPLNAIIGLTELLKDSSLDEEQLDYVNIISNSGESLLGLISDLFDFSAIGSGTMKLRNEPLSLRKIVDQTLASFLPQAASRGIELTGTVHEGVPEEVGGDSKRVQQVLTCLIQNAFKFTKKGFVRLSVKSVLVSSGSQRIEFTVEDSGSGMNPVTMRRLFDSFQQGDNSSTREYGGAGLGLAISKKLIELMGGAIDVESREGQGSIFRFYILDRFVNKNAGGSSGVFKLLKGCRVCIWSDDPADMHLAESLLERCGAVPFYKESLAEITENETDGIPTDVILCNLDFAEIAGHFEELRNIRPDIPWIAFSKWMTPLDAGDKRCFSAFIDRPLEESQLYRVLERLLGTQK